MPKLRRPIDLSPYLEVAQKHVKKISDKLDLQCAILDDWHADDSTKGARIIYQIDRTPSCGSKCDECPLFNLVGEDVVVDEEKFYSSLCIAKQKHLDLFSLGKENALQKYLNCKTLSQYEEAFALCVVHWCKSKELLNAELEWIKQYRLLYHQNCSDSDQLQEEEIASKKRVLKRVLFELAENNDNDRIKLVKQFVNQKMPFSL